MFQQWYERLIPAFTEVNLIASDTYVQCIINFLWIPISIFFSFRDSYIFACKTDDLDKSLESLSDVFDFSNYPDDHHLYSSKFKAGLGRWKNELAGFRILSAGTFNFILIYFQNILFSVLIFYSFFSWCEIKSLLIRLHIRRRIW